MSYTFKDFKDRVKADATRNQGGTQFDTQISVAINSSLMRIARDSNWRSLRREDTFDTISTYSTGSGGGTFTNDSKNITMVGATFVTDDIQIGRRISLQGSNKNYIIAQVTGETTLVLDQVYDGTTISGTGTYSILAQEEYNLPAQASHRIFLWHEEYGSPYPLNYIPEQEIMKSGISFDTESTPTHYRMWGENMIIEQIKTPSVVNVASSSSSDTSININVFGTVGGYPDRETIVTNASDGTTSVAGSKSFQSVERIVSEASTVGRITATANSGGDTLAVIPAGDTTAGIQYSKVRLYPLPNRIFPIHVYYYKDPYRLVSDGDIHELGPQFDEAICLLAISKVLFASSKQEGAAFFEMYKDEIKNLRRHNVDKVDWMPELKSRGSSRGDFLLNKNLRVSQVGAHFGVRS